MIQQKTLFPVGIELKTLTITCVEVGKNFILCYLGKSQFPGSLVLSISRQYITKLQIRWFYTERSLWTLP